MSRSSFPTTQLYVINVLAFLVDIRLTVVDQPRHETVYVIS